MIKTRKVNPCGWDDAKLIFEPNRTRRSTMELPHVTEEGREDATPFTEGRFPQCLRPEIERLAQVLYERRVAEGLPEDPFQDWVDAEAEVMASHESSPARLLPGGDLFPLLVD